MSRPSLFVGSSSEGLPVAEAVQRALDGTASVTLWHNGVFGLGDGTLEALVAATKKFDFAVLVLTADDLLTTRGKRHPSARDNVVFEAGLFLGTLGRHRAFLFFDKSRRLKLPSDLAGITMASFESTAGGDIDSQVAPAVRQIREAIVQLGPLKHPPAPFWSPFVSSQDCRIVLGGFGDEFRGFEESGMIGAGDAICYAEVAAFLRAQFGSDPPLRFADRLDGEELANNLILIGGPDANSQTQRVVRRINTTLTPGAPAINEIAFRSAVTNRLYVPARQKDELTDYGIILRAQNPFSAPHHVLALFGCYGFGTWAAGRLTGLDSFLSSIAVMAGDNIECVLSTIVIHGVPQRPEICELRSLR